MATMSNVRAAYQEASGRWTGCNWPTHYGSLGLDLDGTTADQALKSARRWRGIATNGRTRGEITAGEETSLVDMALHLRLRREVVCLGGRRRRHLELNGAEVRRVCAEVLAREWEFAACWLAEIEADARWAEEEAREAVRAAGAGNWAVALEHAQRACSIESGYHAPLPWRRLVRTIERASK